MSDQKLFVSDEEQFKVDYFQKIESHFATLRHSGILLSPSDYHLAMKWFKQGISLSCVLRGIRTAFFKFDDSNGQEIRSLSYCTWAVLDEFVQFRSINVQSVDLTSDKDTFNSAENIEATLDSFIFDFKRAQQRATEKDMPLILAGLDTVIDDLQLLLTRWLEEPASEETQEKLLGDIDSYMIDIVCKNISSKHQAALLKIIDKKLERYSGSMSKEQLEATREKGYQTLVRATLLLPKITLYSLNS